MLGNDVPVTVTTDSANFVASACDVARMFTVPAATPVTLPVPSTVAVATLPLVQFTACDALLPTDTVAANWPVAPTATESVPGVTVTELTIAVASTRIAAVPLFVASNVDVAVMLTLPGATAVTSPVPLTVATPAALVLHVTAVDAPPTAVTFAANCAVVPTMMAACGLVTVTELTAGRGFTVRRVLPLLVASNVDVAVIVTCPGATAVTWPVGVTVAIAASADDHVTVVAAPLTTMTLAVSWT